MAATERDVRLADGRVLRVLDAGVPEGRPVFVLHGSPASRLLYAPHVRDAVRQGIRLIGHDRPGYGGSTRQPGRSMADEASDVKAIADAMGAERFAVWGHSAGAVPALACAALLRDRVVAVAALSGVAPYPAPGFDWFEGMGESNVTDFQLMLHDRAAWEAKGREEMAGFARATPDDVVRFLDSLLSDVDRRVLTPELAAFLRDQGAEGVRPGPEGAIDDGLAQVAPWGFEIADVRGPVQYWHGRHDRFVPFLHGQWLAAHLPRAEIHLEENEGHLSLFTERIPEVHAWLAAHF